MQKFSQKSIGTTLSILIREEDNLSHIFHEIDIFLKNFEQKFSRFIPHNWLFDLNKNKTATLDSHAFIMMNMMKKIAYETNWHFDPTIGKRLSELGYGNQEIFFSPEKFLHRNFDEIFFFDEKNITIKWGFELEFWGIGKWYLIDWIYNFLIKNLTKNTEFLINFWWDMACVGRWKIALESPFVEGEAIWILHFENAFLACSAWNKRKFQKSHHLINPFSQESATEVAATFLITPNTTKWGGMITDGFSTAIAVMNWQDACKNLTKNTYIEWVLLHSSSKFFKKCDEKFELFTWK